MLKIVIYLILSVICHTIDNNDYPKLNQIIFEKIKQQENQIQEIYAQINNQTDQRIFQIQRQMITDMIGSNVKLVSLMHKKKELNSNIEEFYQNQQNDLEKNELDFSPIEEENLKEINDYLENQSHKKSKRLRSKKKNLYASYKHIMDQSFLYGDYNKAMNITDLIKSNQTSPIQGIKKNLEINLDLESQDISPDYKITNRSTMGKVNIKNYENQKDDQDNFEKKNSKEKLNLEAEKDQDELKNHKENKDLLVKQPKENKNQDHINQEETKIKDDQKQKNHDQEKGQVKENQKYEEKNNDQDVQNNQEQEKSSQNDYKHNESSEQILDEPKIQLSKFQQHKDEILNQGLAKMFTKKSKTTTKGLQNFDKNQNNFESKTLQKNVKSNFQSNLEALEDLESIGELTSEISQDSDNDVAITTTDQFIKEAGHNLDPQEKEQEQQKEIEEKDTITESSKQDSNQKKNEQDSECYQQEDDIDLKLEKIQDDQKQLKKSVKIQSKNQSNHKNIQKNSQKQIKFKQQDQDDEIQSKNEQFSQNQQKKEDDQINLDQQQKRNKQKYASQFIEKYKQNMFNQIKQKVINQKILNNISNEQKHLRKNINSHQNEKQAQR